MRPGREAPSPQDCEPDAGKLFTAGDLSTEVEKGILNRPPVNGSDQSACFGRVLTYLCSCRINKCLTAALYHHATDHRNSSFIWLIFPQCQMFYSHCLDGLQVFYL